MTELIEIEIKPPERKEQGTRSDRQQLADGNRLAKRHMAEQLLELGLSKESVARILHLRLNTKDTSEKDSHDQSHGGTL